MAMQSLVRKTWVAFHAGRLVLLMKQMQARLNSPQLLRVNFDENANA